MTIRFPWLTASLAVAVLVLLPVLALAWAAREGNLALWSHLASSVLPHASLNTVLLLLGVGSLTALIGTGSAWLVTAYDFPGRGALSWALLLPLAVPTYIVAYAYLDLLHPLGPVQGALRWLMTAHATSACPTSAIWSVASCCSPWCCIPTCT